MGLTLGEKIRAARESAGLTQEDLGKLCKTTKQTIYKYETGIVTNIPIDKLEAIANALGIQAASLLGWENKKMPTEAGEHNVTDDDIKFALFGGDGEITDSMYEEVRSFAAFVKRREEQKKKG